MFEESLARVLVAFCNLEPHTGYCQGMNFLAGLFVIMLDDEEDAFWQFAAVVKHYALDTL